MVPGPRARIETINWGCLRDFHFCQHPVHGSPRARSVSDLGFLLFLSGKVPLFERGNHLVNSLRPLDYREGPWQFEVNRWISGSMYVLLNIRVN